MNLLISAGVFLTVLGGAHCLLWATGARMIKMSATFFLAMLAAGIAMLNHAAGWIAQ